MVGTVAAITAGSLAASALGAQANWSSQQNAQAFSAEEAAKAREFQERMSNTQFQRTIKDMEAAGLNPNLLLGSAGGVNTPSASTASASGLSRYDFSNVFSNAVAFAMAKDKHLSNEIIQNMKVASAREVAQIRNAGMLDYAYRNNAWKAHFN